MTALLRDLAWFRDLCWPYRRTRAFRRFLMRLDDAHDWEDTP